MPWSTVKNTAVTNSKMTPQEIAALTLIQGSSTLLGEILNEKINAVRSMIRGAGGLLDADGTLPDSVIPAVVDMVRWEWIASFPGAKQFLTDARKGAMERADAFLSKVATGSVKVELPAAGQAQSVSSPIGGVQQVSGDSRRLTRHKLKGL